MSQTYKPFLRPQRQPHSEMTLRMIIRTPLEGSSESRQNVSAENRPFETFGNGGCNLKLAMFRAGRQVNALQLETIIYKILHVSAFLGHYSHSNASILTPLLHTFDITSHYCIISLLSN